MHFYRSGEIACPSASAIRTRLFLAMDDRDALARLYPVSGGPQTAGRIYGSVYFTNASGNALQAMQGVNVVARLMVAASPRGSML